MFFFCFSETRVNVVVEEKACLFCLLSKSCFRVHATLFFVKWIRNNFFLENSAFHLALSRNFVCFCFVWQVNKTAFFCHSTSHLGFQRTNSTNVRFFLFCFVSKQLNRKKLFFYLWNRLGNLFHILSKSKEQKKKTGKSTHFVTFFFERCLVSRKGDDFFFVKKDSAYLVREFFCLFRKLSKSQGWRPFLEGPEQTTVAG